MRVEVLDRRDERSQRLYALNLGAFFHLSNGDLCQVIKTNGLTNILVWRTDGAFVHATVAGETSVTPVEGVKLVLQ